MFFLVFPSRKYVDAIFYMHINGRSSFISVFNQEWYKIVNTYCLIVSRIYSWKSEEERERMEETEWEGEREAVREWEQVYKKNDKRKRVIFTSCQAYWIATNFVWKLWKSHSYECILERSFFFHFSGSFEHQKYTFHTAQSCEILPSSININDTAYTHTPSLL